MKVEVDMTIITLPPEIEGPLREEARRRGMSPGLLALEALRDRFAPPVTSSPDQRPEPTLADFLTGTWALWRAPPRPSRSVAVSVLRRPAPRKMPKHETSEKTGLESCPTNQTPRAFGSQRILCCWSWRRTGRCDSRIHPASSVGLTWPNAAEKRTALGQVMHTDHVHGPLEIGTVAEDELELVAGLEPFDVAPHVRLHLARAGRLDVEDDEDPGIDRAGIECAAGLEQDGLAGIGQAAHQRIDLELKQGLPAGDLDEVVAQRKCPCDDDVHAHRLPLVEGVGRVAVDASQVTGRQPHKHARQPRERALPLEAAIDLMDHQRPRRLPCQRPQPLRVRSGIHRRPVFSRLRKS